MEQRVRRARQATSTEEAIATVTASGVGIEDEKRKVISVRKFVTDPAYVRVSAGVTKSTGEKFEFLRIDVAISVPCYVEEIEKVQRRTEAMVAGMLDESISNYMGETNG